MFRLRGGEHGTSTSMVVATFTSVVVGSSGFCASSTFGDTVGSVVATGAAVLISGLTVGDDGGGLLESSGDTWAVNVAGWAGAGAGAGAGGSAVAG